MLCGLHGCLPRPPHPRPPHCHHLHDHRILQAWAPRRAIRFLVEDVNSLLAWKVVVPVPDLSFEGRRGIGVEGARDEAAGSAPTEDAWAAARERLALARSFRARLDAGEARTHAELARLVGGISPSRLSQILQMLQLAPSLKERIEQDRASPLSLPDPVLRRIAGLPDHEAQVEAFDTAMELLRRKRRKAPPVIG
jgi:hypothetical protein